MPGLWGEYSTAADRAPRLCGSRGIADPAEGRLPPDCQDKSHFADTAPGTRGFHALADGFFGGVTWFPACLPEPALVVELTTSNQVIVLTHERTTQRQRRWLTLETTYFESVLP